MSYDQKPARMRVVGSGGADAQRRRGENAAVAAAEPADVTTDASAPAGEAGRGMMLPALFLVGCAIGGAALPLARTL